MTQLIVIAENFGSSIAVNQAVAQAHERGILTTASLMVTGAAVDDAVARSHHLPDLALGLHLVLVGGKPLLPPDRIPEIIDPDGNFYADPVRFGIKLHFSRAAQLQAQMEIHAQFMRFLDSGLRLDHVNAHHHFHQHPVVLDFLLSMARQYGIKTVHAPYAAPFHPSRMQETGLWRRLAAWLVYARHMEAMRRRLREAHIAYNDYSYGGIESRAMAFDPLPRFPHKHQEEGAAEVCRQAAFRYEGDPDASSSEYRCGDKFRGVANPNHWQRLETDGISSSSPFSAKRAARTSA